MWRTKLGNEFRACLVAGCAHNAHHSKGARGWCAGHYRRWRKYGDPLAGHTSKGACRQFFEAALLYRGDECLTWPYGLNENGYGTIRINGKMGIVSRLICEAVKGPPPLGKFDAAHSCGNGHLGCVNPNHLSWKTRKENIADELIHGTRRRGERHHSAKLTEGDVRAIRAAHGQIERKELKRIFGVSGDAISNVQNGRSWQWLDEQPHHDPKIVPRSGIYKESAP